MYGEFIMLLCAWKHERYWHPAPTPTQTWVYRWVNFECADEFLTTAGALDRNLAGSSQWPVRRCRHLGDSLPCHQRSQRCSRHCSQHCSRQCTWKAGGWTKKRQLQIQKPLDVENDIPQRYSVAFRLAMCLAIKIFNGVLRQLIAFQSFCRICADPRIFRCWYILERLSRQQDPSRTSRTPPGMWKISLSSCKVGATEPRMEGVHHPSSCRRGCLWKPWHGIRDGDRSHRSVCHARQAWPQA